ncbi:MAG TPA: hypothetical protein VLA58_11730 [Chitinophagaceae bacterium]|nr:hypothetical protein [Chitinophagaceae bacterium]
MKSKILSLHPDYDEVDQKINAAFSFRPYVEFLRNRVINIQGKSPDLYRYIISRLESEPELLSPIRDIELLNKHYDLVQLTISSLFALHNSVDHLYFHVSVPYRFDVIYQSHSSNNFFYTEEDQYIRFHKGIDLREVIIKQEFLAYRMILRKCYGIDVSGIDETVFQHDGGSAETKMYRIFVDENFIDLISPEHLPPFPSTAVSVPDHRIVNMEELRKAIPLSLFRFEGFMVRRVEDLSMEYTITEVKNALIEMHTDELIGYDKLSSALKGLLGYTHADASFSPFIRLNNKYVLSEYYASRSILFSRIEKEHHKEHLYDKLGSVFEEDQQDIIVEDADFGGQGLLNRWMHLLPYQRYVIHPLYDKAAFLGIIEICYDGGVATEVLLQRIDLLVPYIQLAIRNSIRHFHSRIGELVKEHFTPVQPAVEWKFADTAWHYMRAMEKGVEVEMGTVHFDSVYPVYGMIDIRNSSGERSRCVQQDLLDQLDLITETISNMKLHVDEDEREHLNNILFRNQVMRSRVEGVLLAEEELRVSDYLEHEIRSMFRHFGRERSEIDQLARKYLLSVDMEKGYLYRNRRDFDESVGALNSLVTKFLVNEEAKLQKIFPHYFDKYKTDGIEYDIYIGESISRNRQFDHMYLRNIRLWQLSSMVEIARKTAALLPELKIPLQTTQLILVHSHPICITFRSDERRFDVEGGANIRYELIKKRIDKVRVRNTGQRLTQPDCIAIVYTQTKEAEEYEEYIRLLQRKKMLEPDVEKLELEEVQGLSGLRAIRVTVIR